MDGQLEDEEVGLEGSDSYCELERRERVGGSIRVLIGLGQFSE